MVRGAETATFTSGFWCWKVGGKVGCVARPGTDLSALFDVFGALAAGSRGGVALLASWCGCQGSKEGITKGNCDVNKFGKAMLTLGRGSGSVCTTMAGGSPLRGGAKGNVCDKGRPGEPFHGAGRLQCCTGSTLHHACVCGVQGFGSGRHAIAWIGHGTAWDQAQRSVPEPRPIDSTFTERHTMTVQLAPAPIPTAAWQCEPLAGSGQHDFSMSGSAGGVLHTVVLALSRRAALPAPLGTTALLVPPIAQKPLVHGRDIGTHGKATP